MPESRAIVTLATGEFYEKMGQVTHPLMRQYAEKTKATFVVINQPMVQEKYGIPARYEKFQVYRLLEEFDRIAFFDTDILIAPDTPSVFDLVPTDVFGASCEEAFSKSKTDKEQTQIILGAVNWKNVYFNSGVMVFSKAHKIVFDPTEESLKKWATGEFKDIHGPDGADQSYLNHRINKLDILFKDIGYRFNHTRVITATHTRFKSFVIHYAGASGHRYGSRLSQMEKDSRILSSPAQLWLSRKLPVWRWIADRLDTDFLKYLFTEKIGRK